MERTLIIVKPDAVQRGLAGAILGRLETRGLRLTALKFLWVPKALAEQHYAVHEDKPFYPDLVNFITSGPVVAAVFEGQSAVATVRKMIGDTNSGTAAPGTIRGDWGLDVLRNLIHASDSVATGEEEIALWFKPEELVDWPRELDSWI